MKTKPVSHKNTNTFKFQSFNDRISSININVIHRVHKPTEVPEDRDTFFQECLDKWHELNLTDDYAALKKEIGRDVQILTQLLLKKDEIIESLKNVLINPQSLAIDATLELIVALARDLQSEFFAIFPEIFKSLVGLLETKDTEVIEHTFTCFSYLFKFLWRYMIKDIKSIYSFYCPLLKGNQKLYIQKFAAESISFLIRKVKNREEFFSLMLKNVNEDPELANGNGMLLFESVKGVNKKFHSCHEEIIPLLLMLFLKNEDIDVEATFTLFEVMFVYMMKHTERNETKFIWSAFHDVFNMTETIQCKDNRFSYILELFNNLISFKNGSLVLSPTELIGDLIKLLKRKTEDCFDTLLSTVATVLLSRNINLDMKDISSVIDQVFKCGASPSSIFEFTRSVFSYGMFQKDILPPLLQYCELVIGKEDANMEVITIITELILYNYPKSDCDAEEKLSYCYKLILPKKPRRSGRNKASSSLADFIENNMTLEPNEENLTLIWASSLSIPHLVSSKQESYLKLMCNANTSILNLLLECEQEVLASKLAFVLLQVFDSLIKIDSELKVFKSISISDVIKLLGKFKDNVNILRLAVSCFSFINKNRGVEPKIIQEVFSIIQFNLSSPYQQVRLFTLELMNLFDYKLPYSENKSSEHKSVFDICLTAEKIQLSVQEYREVQKYLQKLDYETVKNDIPVDFPLYELVPLRYLLGKLHANFQLLWNPTLELIANHANGLDSKIFWDAFLLHLHESTTYALNYDKNNDEPIDDVEGNLENIFMNELNSFSIEKKTADHENHRNLLWKGMAMFPHIVEPHNREIAALFLDFINNEFFFKDLGSASYQSVLKEKNKSNEKRKVPIKTLCCHLELLSKFKNPRAVHREAEIRDLYFQFLTHRIGDIQKLGLDCIMTYKYKYLTPYGENLYRLLDDKTFKTEVTLFTIDSENSIVETGHRAGLLTVLLRIMYGKMMHKTGSNTSGKANAVTRRAIVLRYLAGTEKDELGLFLDLVFSVFKNLHADTLTAVLDAKNNMDFEKVIPLYRLQSNLNMLNVIFDKLGNLIEQHLPKLLKILLIIMAIVGNLLANSADISVSCLNMLRVLRTNAMSRIIQFFEHYEDYPFSENEVEALFESVIWSQLPFMESDCVSSVSPLLRLFKTWSALNRYHHLFSKIDERYPDPILLYVCRLFAAESTHISTVEAILTLVENLFTIEDLEDMSELISIGNNNLPYAKEESITYGTKLLLPHLGFVLKKMRILVQKSSNNSRKKLTSQQLTILSKASEHVVAKEESSEIISLLLICLQKATGKSEDIQASSFKTIANLLRQVDEPIRFLKSFAGLFSVIQNQVPRSALCHCLDVIAERDDSAKQIARLTSMLNAWNKKRVDEPDYGQRLDGFKEIREIFPTLANQKYFLQNGLIIIRNCCYFMKNTEDMSLRDAASYALQTIVALFIDNKSGNKNSYRTLILDTVVPEIRKNLRNKNEHVRHEFIAVLSKTIETCPDNVQLKELAQLKDQDPEMDFFENIRHIQMHRRARAMTRVAHGIKKKEIILSADILSAYIMPIVSSYIDGTYEKYNNLVDAAILTVGSICRELPWPRYEACLQYYIKTSTKVSEQQKTIIKMLITILEAFHFDLSNSSGLTAKKKKAVKITEDNEAQDEDVDVEERMFGIKNESATVDTTKKHKHVEKLRPEMATRIHNSVGNNILPRLHRILNQKAKSDSEHKSNKKKYPEDEEILRIPIALAMVKLLQNLPKGMLETSLPGILLRHCELLRSKTETIRDITRQTLVKVMTTLGSKYIWFMLREMRATMKRGYNVHVMTFTTHLVLLQMSESKQLLSGDIDSCFRSIVEICHEELFGLAAEEKEVVQITRKLKEARGVKSYNLYMIMAKYISPNLLPDLIMDLKNVLATTHSHKIISKVSECLHHVILGLPNNQTVDVKTLMIFIYGICHETIPKLTINSDSLNKKHHDPRLQPTNTYIIPEEPKRAKISNKKSGPRTNTHILIEFGLQLLNVSLRKDKLDKNCQEHIEMLDPFVSQLSDCLSSQHVKSTSSALRCLIILLRFPLPSLKDHILNLRNAIFVILSKYAGPGLAQGDNFEMVILCFKAITILVRYVPFCEIDEEKIQVLLIYIEQDIHDQSRQATAFSLMKALLYRKIYNEEIITLMRKITDLSITSELEHIRSQCRQVTMQYLLDYPLGKKLDHIISFIVRQLNYEYEPGRESILELLNSMLTSFPEGLISKNSGLFLVSLSMVLVNDESAKCRKMAYMVLKALLRRVNNKVKDNLFSLVDIWFQEQKISKKRLAAQLFGLFAEIEEESFEQRLNPILPVLVQETSYDRTVDDNNHKSITDHLLYHILNSIVKILTSCKIIRNSKYHEDISKLFGNIQQLILHPHAWVRLLVAQIYGLLFSTYSAECVVEAAGSTAISADYLLSNTRQKLRDLTADFCTVLQSELLEDKLAEQVVRNLIYLGKVLHVMELKNADSAEDESNVILTFDWIIRRLLREVKNEVARNPKENIKRSSVFKWIAAISIHLGEDHLPNKLWLLMRPLVREITDSSAHKDENLKQLAQEVLDVIKGIVGVEIFTRKYTETQRKIGEKRVLRKRERAVDALVNPAKAAERKMKKHMAKRVAMKRKIQQLKGNIPTKARRTVTSIP